MKRKFFLMLLMSFASNEALYAGKCTKVHIYYKDGTNWGASANYTPCGGGSQQTYYATNWWDNFLEIEPGSDFNIGPKHTYTNYHTGPLPLPLTGNNEVGIACSGQLGAGSTCDVTAPYMPSQPPKEGCISVHIYYTEDANWGGSAYYTPCGSTTNKREVVNSNWDNYLSVQPNTPFQIGPMGTSTNYCCDDKGFPKGFPISKPQVGIKCSGMIGTDSAKCDPNASYNPAPPMTRKKQPSPKKK